MRSVQPVPPQTPEKSGLSKVVASTTDIMPARITLGYTEVPGPVFSNSVRRRRYRICVQDSLPISTTLYVFENTRPGQYRIK